MSNKVKITWMSDSSGRESIHANGGGTAQQSYLGHLEWKGDKWYFIQRGVAKPHGPYETVAAARRAALQILDAEYV